MSAERHADAILDAVGAVPLWSSFYDATNRTTILAAVTAAMDEAREAAKLGFCEPDYPDVMRGLWDKSREVKVALAAIKLTRRGEVG